MTFPSDIRATAAALLFDDKLRAELRTVADNLETAIQQLFITPTTEAMVCVNSHWIHAVKQMERVNRGASTAAPR